ncbi:MAG: DUF2225 domain-containing protein, partial [Candidatus Zixiibacteriota bacterium]
IKSKIIPYQDKFNNEITSIEDLLNNVKMKMDDFSNLLVEYKSVALGGNPSGNESAFGQFHSFTEYMLSLKEKWNKIVTNEKEALEKAVYYYKEAFAGGRDISPGNQQIQASYLIAELSRRIGDYDNARQYFNSTIKYGQEFIYNNRNDKSRTALARKILELAIEQGKINMEALKSA